MAKNRCFYRIRITSVTQDVLSKNYGVIITYIGGGEFMIEYPIGYSIVTPKGHDKKQVFLIIDHIGKPIADAIWDNAHKAFVLTINNGQTAG